MPRTNKNIQPRRPIVSAVDAGRRATLRWIAAVFGTAILARTGSRGSAAEEQVHPNTRAHSETPEGEIGPYFTDDSAQVYCRSNILANLDGSEVQEGIPLTLTLYAYDTKNNDASMEGVQIDIWHCNATGLYSSEWNLNTSGHSWLRGYQVTDAHGKVTFTTIIPGWYQGRTTHIHLRVRSKYSKASSLNDGTNTTQVFFPQETIDHIYTHIAPYNAMGVDTTTNESDHVFTDQTQGETQLVLEGDYAKGFSSTFAIYLPIASA